MKSIQFPPPQQSCIRHAKEAQLGSQITLFFGSEGMLQLCSIQANLRIILMYFAVNKMSTMTVQLLDVTVTKEKLYRFWERISIKITVFFEINPFPDLFHIVR